MVLVYNNSNSLLVFVVRLLSLICLIFHRRSNWKSHMFGCVISLLMTALFWMKAESSALLTPYDNPSGWQEWGNSCYSTRYSKRDLSGLWREGYQLQTGTWFVVGSPTWTIDLYPTTRDLYLTAGRARGPANFHHRDRSTSEPTPSPRAPDSQLDIFT